MRLLQLTDLHLMGDVKDSPNNKIFQKVIRFLKENISRLNVDYIIVTGDISHDGSNSSYLFFLDEMKRSGVRFSFIHGNHDCHRTLDNLDKPDNYTDFDRISDSEWSVLNINSVVDGEDYGYIDDKNLNDFEQKLSIVKNKSIVFLHHHVIPVGTPIVDECKLKNSEVFLTICRKLKVNVIASGHAHTLFQRKIEDTLVTVSPAVCSQWLNGTIKPEYINNTGFSIINLDEIVHVETYFI
jgi:Icc protein